MMTGTRYLVSGARARAGFTILDVLATLVVVGILAAVATPRFGRTVAATRVNRAISAVGGELELAGTLAARQRKPVRVSYDAPSAELRIADRSTGTVLRRLPLGTASDYMLASVSLSPASVEVFPTGLSSGALTVSVSGAGHTRRATMSRAGYVRVVP